MSVLSLMNFEGDLQKEVDDLKKRSDLSPQAVVERDLLIQAVEKFSKKHASTSNDHSNQWIAFFQYLYTLNKSKLYLNDAQKITCIALLEDVFKYFFADLNKTTLIPLFEHLASEVDAYGFVALLLYLIRRFGLDLCFETKSLQNFFNTYANFGDLERAEELLQLLHTDLKKNSPEHADILSTLIRLARPALPDPNAQRQLTNSSDLSLSLEDIKKIYPLLGSSLLTILLGSNDENSQAFLKETLGVFSRDASFKLFVEILIESPFSLPVKNQKIRAMLSCVNARELTDSGDINDIVFDFVGKFDNKTLDNRAALKVLAERGGCRNFASIMP